MISLKTEKEFAIRSTIIVLILFFSAIPLLAQNITKIPAEFIGNRIYVTPQTNNGVTIRFFTDTGGGTNLIFPSTIGKNNFKVDSLTLGKRSVAYIPFPEFSENNTIPAPAEVPPFGNKLIILGGRQAALVGGDGLLGRTWFSGKIWKLDYLDHKMEVLDSFHPANSKNNHIAHLGFQKNPAGNKTTFFPRIPIIVGSDTLNMLFDTGATLKLVDNVYKKMDDGLPQKRGTSFISESIFNKWKKAHPDWKVVENAATLMHMPVIKVPSITVAGYSVGPVWFTMRPDKSFHQMMSRFMDKEVDGALGGSAFKYFKIILNYPEEYALFSK